MHPLKQTNREKGTSLFLGTIALVFIVPLIGLFIDVGILYSAKARLQAAVDGASLAAARSLNLGQTTAAQATTAKQNAVNWFYANFPTGNWATTNTNMTLASVTVQDDPNNPQLRDVSLTASTQVPTWFMRWFNVSSTTLNASGQASRRDVVAMLVLDRSGSMCSINGAPAAPPCGLGDGTPCDAMITAAKNFTGAFAAGRDRIGLLTFSDGSYLDSKPVTNFQTLLGYSNASGNAAGLLDNIKCNGGTGTAEAVSLAYNELYKLALPGALNVVMLETDGLPNTLVYNWWDGATAGIANASGCKDTNNKTKSGGGWATLPSMKQWTPGYNMSNGGTGYMSNIPAGAIGSFYTSDPIQGTYMILMYNPWQAGDTGGNNSIAVSGSGCTFSGGTTGDYSDFAWLPSQDVYGNKVNPANAYLSLTLSGGHNLLNGGSDAANWPNTHAAALNATDNSAYNVRTNATLPAYVFVIGLGGNHGNPPDAILLQRMANDPNGDLFNSPPSYSACASEPTCISYSNQPQGTFIYSPTTASLGQAFLKISSQVLRLSR
jgi:Flp pilus assembly protein TadG